MKCQIERFDYDVLPKKIRSIPFRDLLLLFFACMCLFGIIYTPAYADRLPAGMPENQVFSLKKTIDSHGMINEDSSISWIVASGENTIGITRWKDNLLTSGGDLSVVKKASFDSSEKGRGLYNLESGKVLTYQSTNGSHLIGEETYFLDIAGNYSSSSSGVRCVFAPALISWEPAFCNVVRSSAHLININNAQISELGSLRMTGPGTPAVLNYQIAVNPDTSQGSKSVEGTVKTDFSGSITEGFENTTNISATNRWRDSTEVYSGINQMKETFVYGSGFLL